MIIIGLIFGFAIRMFDIYTQVLGAIFSSISVYILIGVMITLNSKNKWYAMRDCFLMDEALICLLNEEDYEYNDKRNMQKKWC